MRIKNIFKEGIDAVFRKNRQNIDNDVTSVSNPVYADAIENGRRTRKAVDKIYRDLEKKNKGMTPDSPSTGKRIKNAYTERLTLDESLFEETETETVKKMYNEKNESKTMESRKRNRKLNEGAKIIGGLSDYTAWSGAVDTYNRIEEEGKLDELDSLIEELYPEGITSVQLNDLLWFESEWIFEMLGMDSEYEDDEYEDEYEDDEYEDDEDEDEQYSMNESKHRIKGKKTCK